MLGTRIGKDQVRVQPAEMDNMSSLAGQCFALCATMFLTQYWSRSNAIISLSKAYSATPSPSDAIFRDLFLT
eukprot:scaffold561621_cov17-Prasinocladus_malaysianus.AAC.2